MSFAVDVMNAESHPMIDPAAFEHVARPLLQLIQHLSGMETSFVTGIDWEDQQQEVIFSLNTGEMQILEHSQVDWGDSMCRSMFLSERDQSCAVGIEVPATSGAKALQMRSFFAVPIVVADNAIGTVCGASQRQVVLSESAMESMRLIAEAIRQLLETQLGRKQAEARALHAEREAVHARSEATRHAGDAARMEELAHTDVLTGLPNRRAFTARWEDELARSARRHYQIGLLLIDADRFKEVNDSRGHLGGDAVLTAIGKAIQAVTSTADATARLGGDEFAIAITHIDKHALLAKADALRHAFAATTSEIGVDTTLSIGIASSDHCPRHHLFAAADEALYRSKAAGGDCAHLLAPASGSALGKVSDWTGLTS